MLNLPDPAPAPVGADKPLASSRPRSTASLARGRHVDIPGWERIQATASTQHGLFTERQAADFGVTTRLLRLLVRMGRIEPVRWRIFRIAGSPSTPYDPLVLAWLWSGQRGILSHESALALHGLEDPGEDRIHLVIAPGLQVRHTRPPSEILLHVESVPESEVEVVRGLPALCVERALAQTLRRLSRSRIRRILEHLADRLPWERGAALNPAEA